MTALVSLLFIAMIPIDCKITKFLYACYYMIHTGEICISSGIPECKFTLSGHRILALAMLIKRWIVFQLYCFIM